MGIDVLPAASTTQRMVRQKQELILIRGYTDLI